MLLFFAACGVGFVADDGCTPEADDVVGCRGGLEGGDAYGIRTDNMQGACHTSLTHQHELLEQEHHSWNGLNSSCRSFLL